MMNLVIPEGKLAGAQQLTPEQMREKIEAEKRRRELAEKLKNKTPVTISPTGEVGKNGTLKIPGGTLAGAQQASPAEVQAKIAAEAEARRRREALAAALKGGATPINLGTITIPTGKLAAAIQWYEKDPSLLVAEKAAMAKAFPNFQLEPIGDGRLAWTGTLTPGIWKGFWAAEDDLSARQTWEVMAIYENNHPNQQMGSSVKVFLLYPTIETVIEHIGWRPYHLLHDPISNQDYLCTAQAEDVKVGETSTSAASVLAWAVKWLTAFELVMTGDLSKEDFNTHGVI